MGLDFAGAEALGGEKRGSSGRFLWVVPENNVVSFLSLLVSENCCGLGLL
jgi:hypothetical protein